MRLAATQSRGLFGLAGKPPTLPRPLESVVRWEVGWYNESLPRFLLSHPEEEVSLLHVDCDLYSSTTTVLTLLASRMRAGTVIIFDELYNYPEYRSHELLALWEFLRDHRGFALRLLAVSTHDIELAPRVENFKQACAFVLVAAPS